MARNATMRGLMAALAIAALPAANASAQKVPTINCSTAVNTHELNWCSEQALIAADKKLNETYKQVLAHIAKSEELAKGNREKWANALRLAQRHWVAFRDQDCGEVIGYAWGGGTGMTGAMLGCKLAKTEIRTKELEELLPQ